MEPLPETDEALDEYLEEDDEDLRATLGEMAREARRLVPSCVGLSLGLVRDGLTFTFVATAREIAAIDAAQYFDGGPCVDVAAGAEVKDLDIPDLLDEQRWSAFALASAAQGVRSTLSLPVLHRGNLIGGINLYAASTGAFHGKHEALAAALGATAEGAMSDADLDFRSRDLARLAPRTIAERRMVDVAVGILAARYHLGTGDAEQRLQSSAARAGVTAAQAATVVVQTAQD
jgi:GAF domain-containing protein